MSKNYKRWRKNIPSEVYIGPNRKFRVEWADHIGASKNGKPHYGETRFRQNNEGENVIRLYAHQTDEQAVHTFFHEFLHAFHTYNNFRLSETHIRKLERKFEVFMDLFLTLNKRNDKTKKKEIK